MELKDYQRLSQRTLNLGGVHSEQITNMALGIAGEAGEVVDLIKKHVFHGHDLNDDKAIEELGDLMFYIAGLATLLGYDLDEIGAYNVDKLKRRYEKGFSQEASKARVDVAFLQAKEHASRVEACVNCGGTGMEDFTHEECPACDGEGINK